MTTARNPIVGPRTATPVVIIDPTSGDPVTDVSPVTLTGDVVVDTFGALDDAAATDPGAASATIPALLRGILAELQDQTVILATIATNTTPAP